jgi:hypothetical protein
VTRALLAALLLAGCAAAPPHPLDAAAKRFETVPGKAVIYVVRDGPDSLGYGSVVTLDGEMIATVHPGTYLRLETAPGARRLAGYAGDGGGLTLRTGPGGLYFVRQSVQTSHLSTRSSFHPLSEAEGRTAVRRSALVYAP